MNILLVPLAVLLLAIETCRELDRKTYLIERSPKRIEVERSIEAIAEHRQEMDDAVDEIVLEGPRPEHLAAYRAASAGVDRECRRLRATSLERAEP